MKRAEFISNAVRVRENFSFAHPLEVIDATVKYCTSFTGGTLWDLRGKAATMLYSSWDTNVKLIWQLPRSTHSYFIETVLAPTVTSPRVSLMMQFLIFFRSLFDSPCLEIQVLSRLGARDIRTNIGSNLAHVKTESGLDPWLYGGDRIRKELLKYNRKRVPESDKWRIGYLEKLLAQRLIMHYEMEDVDTVTNLIESLVIN